MTPSLSTDKFSPHVSWPTFVAVTPTALVDNPTGFWTNFLRHSAYNNVE